MAPKAAAPKKKAAPAAPKKKAAPAAKKAATPKKAAAPKKAATPATGNPQDGMKTMVELKKWATKHTDAEGWNARLIGFTWQASMPDATGYVEEKWFWTPPHTSGTNKGDKDKKQDKGQNPNKRKTR